MRDFILNGNNGEGRVKKRVFLNSSLRNRTEEAVEDLVGMFEADTQRQPGITQSYIA